MCPHGGKVQPISTNTRVKAMSDYMLRTSDTFTIADCSFNVVRAASMRKGAMDAADGKKSGMGDSTLTKEVSVCALRPTGCAGTDDYCIYTTPRYRCLKGERHDPA